jgi:hypothetical protein
MHEGKSRTYTEADIPPQLEEPYRQIIGFIDAISREHRRPADLRNILDRDRAPFGDVLESLPETVSMAITIDADRGMGKTTLLKTLISELRRADSPYPPHIVPDPIVPDLFGETDLPMGWALAALHDSMEALTSPTGSGSGERDERDQRTHGGRSETARVWTWFEGVRQTALSIFGPPATQGMGDLSAYEYGRELGVTLSDTYHLQRKFGCLIEALLSLRCPPDRQQSNHHGSPLVIFSFDDLDLAAVKASEVLTTVRILAGIPRVVVIVAGHEDTFRSGLLAESVSEKTRQMASVLVRDEGPITTDSLIDLAGKQLDKALPNHYRVRLAELPPDQRLRFRPVGRERTLRDVLTKHGQEGLNRQDLGIENVAELFDLRPFLEGKRDDSDGGRDYVPSQLANALPGCPRILVQLYEHLDRPNDAESSPVPTEDGPRLLQTLYEYGVKSVSPQYRTLMQDLVDWMHRWIDLSQVATTTRVQGATHIGLGNRRILKVRPRIQEVLVDARSDPGVELGPAESALAFLLHDVADAAETDLATSFGIVGPRMRPGGSEASSPASLHARGRGESLDYWKLPRWGYWCDFFLYYQRWQRCVREFMDHGQDSSGDVSPQAQADALFLGHVQAVLDTAERARGEGELSMRWLLESPPNDRPERSEAWRTKLGDRALDLCEKGVRGSGPSAQWHLVDWILYDFRQHFERRSVSDEVWRWMGSLHSKLSRWRFLQSWRTPDDRPPMAGPIRRVDDEAPTSTGNWIDKTNVIESRPHELAKLD